MTRACGFASASAFACAIAGCVVYSMPPAPPPHAARILASNDFNCPYDAVDVSNVGGDEYVAFGCGRRETFACVRVASEDELRCDRVVGRFDDDLPLRVTYAPQPTCYAACSASSSATCMASCNGGGSSASP